MPPRFVVLPLSESVNPAIEMLEQIRTTPVFYEIDAGNVVFRDLDRVIAEHLET